MHLLGWRVNATPEHTRVTVPSPSLPPLAPLSPPGLLPHLRGLLDLGDLPDRVLAVLGSVVALAWGILALVANATAISPAKAAIPCDGKCGSCPSDPHCAAWAASVMATHGLSNICPPARHEAGSFSNATFSCVADASW